jgi:hypothetical protein
MLNLLLLNSLSCVRGLGHRHMQHSLHSSRRLSSPRMMASVKSTTSLIKSTVSYGFADVHLVPMFDDNYGEACANACVCVYVCMCKDLYHASTSADLYVISCNCSNCSNAHHPVSSPPLLTHLVSSPTLLLSFTHPQALSYKINWAACPAWTLGMAHRCRERWRS